ncbi:hypothetical protein BDK92_5247 [Micromonospora pisi]|uniref:Tachylectin n=1 Tax=Micromonospora pisi TaxID=589240 RepID=A0A495JPG6_9ACTN|nr:hypothetical protein [Micromonospora pisi]RKR90863.1 hypothetical protein BDK92_5247 [Micromonospora pisi]
MPKSLLQRIVPQRIIATATSVLAAATLGLTVVAVDTITAAPTPAQAASSVGGQITRDEVLARARWWIDRYGAIYSQNQADQKPDQDGHPYRPDCSGFVSMAWHLPKSGGGDRSTRTLATFGDTTWLDSLGELLPGDAILGVSYGHVALFEKWVDSSRTQMWVYEEYQPGLEGRRVVKSRSWYESEGFRGLKYNNVTDGVRGNANIYGVLADGRLTFTAVEAATGDRIRGASRSETPLPFAPRAMATLDYNTILFTSTANELWRVDIGTNDGTVTFRTPTRLADSGWSHDLLTYDGSGHLYGIADGVLRRYTVTATKPEITDITGYVTIADGFGLKTLTAAGPDWLLGTVADGRLRSYRIDGPGDWTGSDLRESTWQAFTNLVSPGGGVYFGHQPTSMNHYIDLDPYDFDGADITSTGVIDPSGWTQTLISAQPGTVS